MHVLQMIDTISMGGAERLLVTFTRQAGRHSLKTSIIGLQEDCQNPIMDDLQKLDVKIVQFSAKGLFSLNRFYKIIRFLREEQVDVIQTHLTYANILGGLAGWLTSTPVAATLHSTHYRPSGIKGLRDMIECWVLKHLACKVIAVGKSVAVSYEKVLGYKAVCVIRNAVCPVEKIPDTMIQRIKAEFEIRNGQPIILAVGRTVPAKGYFDLIEAVRLLHMQFPKAHLVVVGDGSLFRDLTGYIKKNKLDHFIHFIGEREDVSAWMAASDIFVSSSHWEGLPLAVLEAMMAGLPIVATRVGELSEIINHENGILVPPKNPRKLSKALVSLLQDPLYKKKMGIAAQKEAKLHFSADVWFDRMMQLFQQMTKECRNGAV